MSRPSSGRRFSHNRTHFLHCFEHTTSGGASSEVELEGRKLRAHVVIRLGVLMSLNGVVDRQQVWPVLSRDRVEFPRPVTIHVDVVVHLMGRSNADFAAILYV
jgi:hypothetical protein